jgi:ribosomal 50S subunit-recycling heat shock protein
MRLDKYLKVSRLIKRRTLANEACDSERVKLNGRTAKAGAEVNAGDVVEIRFGAGLTKVEILSVSEHATKDGAKEMYRLLPP